MAQAHEAAYLVKELISFFLCCEGVQYFDSNFCLTSQIFSQVNLTEAALSQDSFDSMSAQLGGCLIFAASRSAIRIRSCSERYRGLSGLGWSIFTGA